MDLTVSIILIPISLIFGGAFNYLLGLLYHRDEGANIYFLVCIVGILSYVLEPNYSLYLIYLFYIGLIYFYVSKYASKLSRLLKIFLSSLIVLSLFFVGGGLFKDVTLSLALISLSLFALPAITNKKLNTTGFIEIKAIHFVFRLSVLHAIDYLAVLSLNNLYFIALIMVVYLIFSFVVHASYNKMHEELSLSLFFVLVAMICSLPLSLLSAYVVFLYISDYGSGNYYGHGYDVKQMAAWLSPLGVKTVASFYLISEASVVVSSYYLLPVFLIVLVYCSTYRSSSSIKTESHRKDKVFQKILWLILATFILSEKIYAYIS